MREPHGVRLCPGQKGVWLDPGRVGTPRGRSERASKRASGRERGRRERRNGETETERFIFRDNRAAALCRRPRWEVRIFRHFFPTRCTPPSPNRPSPCRSTDFFASFLHFRSDRRERTLPQLRISLNESAVFNAILRKKFCLRKIVKFIDSR